MDAHPSRLALIGAASCWRIRMVGPLADHASNRTRGIVLHRIQIRKSGQEMGAYCYPTLRRLSPGQGDVIQVILPEGFQVQGRWRFTCAYTRDGTRSRIADWKWDAESYTKSFRA
jgi:hypothetical protein